LKIRKKTIDPIQFSARFASPNRQGGLVPEIPVGKNFPKIGIDEIG